MGAPDAIPDLQLSHPDGTPLTRIEADQHIRETLRKVHWLRILANKRYGLAKQFTFGMTELMLRHWFLDEAIRRGEIVGDVVGINSPNYNDENEIRQFTQRLVCLIQAGQAVQPKEGEGIDMVNIPQSPPGTMNQQSIQGFIPPPPPPMGIPGGPPSQGFIPPGPPQSYSPPQPPQPPQPQQNFIPQAPPMMPPGYAPPPGTPSMMPPQSPPPQAAPPTPARRGRGKAEAAPSNMPMGTGGFVPQVPQGQPFLPLPQNMAPQGQSFLPLPSAPNPNGASSTLDALLQKIDQLTQTVSVLSRKLDMTNLAVTALSRAHYMRNGTAEIEVWLRELGVQLPQ